MLVAVKKVKMAKDNGWKQKSKNSNGQNIKSTNLQEPNIYAHGRKIKSTNSL